LEGEAGFDSVAGFDSALGLLSTFAPESFFVADSDPDAEEPLSPAAAAAGGVCDFLPSFP
jgi:hypothetical protein